MSVNLSKYVMPPGQGEVLDLGPPNAGKILITIDPKNTGETRFCMLIQVLDAIAAKDGARFKFD